MLKAYFDDSGTHAQSKMVAIAGFIGDATVWDSFDANWEPILTAPDKSTRLSEFKMYDCVHGVEEFSPPLWGFADYNGSRRHSAIIGQPLVQPKGSRHYLLLVL